FPIQKITFETPGFTLTGDSIDLGAGGVVGLAGTNVIQLDATLGSSSADLIPFAVAGTSTELQMKGRLDGAGLTKQGTGRLVLRPTVDNTYVGLTRVEGGTLFVQQARALGSTAQGAEVLAGATLTLAGDSDFTVAGEALALDGTLAISTASGVFRWTG